VRTGIFNVADVAIMLGAAILLVVHFRSDDGDLRPRVEHQ
jgi:lipoprotein signal peptidase